MSKEFFDFKKWEKNNPYGPKFKTLLSKSNPTKEEKQDLHILQFQKKAALNLPFGIMLDKGLILETIFGNNPFEKFTENEQSLKWDFMVLNLGYDESKKDYPGQINSVYPILSFFKGDKTNAEKIYQIISSGGGGEGAGAATTPPPKQPIP